MADRRALSQFSEKITKAAAAAAANSTHCGSSLVQKTCRSPLSRNQSRSV